MIYTTPLWVNIPVSVRFCSVLKFHWGLRFVDTFFLRFGSQFMLLCFCFINGNWVSKFLCNAILSYYYSIVYGLCSSWSDGHRPGRAYL